MNKIPAVVTAVDKTAAVTYIHVASGETTIQLIKSPNG